MAIGVGAAIGGIASLINTGVGLWQGSKANKMASRLNRPTQNVQQEFLDNSAEAQNMAKVGMSQDQYNQGQSNIGRNITSGLRMLGSRANPLNGVNSLVRASNDATNNLNAQDANMRQRNMLNAMQQRSILGGQKQQAWNWNSRDAYGEKLAEIQALRGSGMANVGNGINSAAQLGMVMSNGQDMSFGGGGQDDGMGGYNSRRGLRRRGY